MSSSPEKTMNGIDYLHIGKCAGNQIEYLLQQISNNVDFSYNIHGHETKLKHLNLSQKYFFSIRNPITRFFSGFYSRKRRGRPKFDNPWTADEERAFEQFPHANEIAESLFRTDLKGLLARKAISSIDHLRNHQVEWFESRGYFLEMQPPLCIVRVEHFDSDFDFFLKHLNLGIALKDLQISSDPIQIHANDYSDAVPLSKLAVQNLESWYQRDIYFYKSCEDWLTYKQCYINQSN